MSEDDRLIAGRYRLGERIGSGGMGVVWQAYDERLGRTVAVKRLLLPAYLAGAEAEEAKQRARRESRIAARIQHQHVIAIYDVVEDEGHTCLVMEYLPSKSLSEVVEERGPLPPADVAQIGVQAASALAAAHAVGVVHRDVKPGNVLLGEAGTVKIVDFGIARAAGDVTITVTGLISGTPAFLSPEVARGDDATFASDVFSLGATLYAAIEGAPPFGRHDNAIALLHRVASGQINPPRHAGVMTPVLLRMLNPNPAGRPGMTEASRALEAVTSTNAPGLAEDEEITREGPVVLPAVLAMPAQQVVPGEQVLAGEESPDPEGPTIPLAARATPVSTDEGVPPAREGLPGPPGSRKRTAVWVAALACVLALAAVATVFALPTLVNLGDPLGQPTRSGGQGGQSPDQTPDPAKRSSEPGRTPERSPSPDKEPSPSPSADDEKKKPAMRTPGEALLAYYRLIPDRLSAGWTWLSPRYRQSTSGSFASYQSWWSRFRSVNVSVISSGSGNPATVMANVRYTRTNGQVFSEVHRYTLVRDGRRWLIDASTVIRG